MNKKGFTLVELIITVAIIGILAGIAIPAYLGQQKRATRAEAFSNLDVLRLLEEQFYSEYGRYTVNLGVCAPDNPNNVTQIQQGGAAPDPNNAIPGFQPGTGLSFSYCIESNIDIDGAASDPCFRAKAFANTNTRVETEIYGIDCNNTQKAF